MSFEALKQQATEGDVRSMNRAAMCLIQGPDGVEKDFKSALIWLEKAAALQSATALYNWNWIYRLGLLGCKKDESKADLCLAQALSAKENEAKIWASIDGQARDLLNNHGCLVYRNGCPIPMEFILYCKL